MKTIRRKFQSAVILVLLLALGLPGCGGGGNGNGNDDEANASELLICLLTFFLVCQARDAQPEAGGLEISTTAGGSDGSPAIELTWKDAGEDRPAAGYWIYRDAALVADTGEPAYTDSTLEADTRYCYTVVAYDESRVGTARSETACATTSWKLETVVPGIEAPRQALALEPPDRIHLAYLGGDESGKRHIGYIRQQAGSREYLDLDPVQTDFADSLAIAVDPWGAIHVGSEEQYFTDISGSWQREVREGFNFSALAIDSNGFVHVVSAGREGGFDHRVDVGGSWSAQRVGDGEWRRLALAVDRFDAVHIAYYDYAARELRYLSNRGANWTTEVIAAGLDPVWRVDLALDANGGAHLTYRSARGDGSAPGDDPAVPRTSLEYASNASGAWRQETFDYGDGVGGMSAIAIDADGRPHISYTAVAAGELRYLTRAAGAWKSTVVDDGLSIAAECGTSVDACGATDIAVDALGRVHIVYPRANSVILATRG